VRQHGVGKRRTWRKIHLGFDADVKDVVAVEVTTVEWTDAEVFAGLLEQVEGEISQVDADGACDTRDVYDAAMERDAKGQSRPEKMPCLGRRAIPAPKPWRTSRRRAWPIGSKRSIITAAASPKMACAA